MPVSLPAIDAWRLRWRTGQAVALLCVAWLAVQLLPFRTWRRTLGRLAPNDDPVAASAGAASPWKSGSAGAARRLAVHVERAAALLPFTAKCLPRAMALCWLLHAARIAYVLKIAARPAAARHDGQLADDDSLHAWVESGGSTVIGALPGPWLVVLVLLG